LASFFLCSFGFKKNGFLPNKAYKNIKYIFFFFFPCTWPKILKIILALFQKNKIFLHVVKNTKKYCNNFVEFQRILDYISKNIKNFFIKKLLFTFNIKIKNLKGISIQNIIRDYNLLLLTLI